MPMGFSFVVSEAWKAAFPGAKAGMLVMHNVAAPDHSSALDRVKEELEQALRARFAGCTRADLKAIPTIQAYDAYFQRHKKTYHVQLQLESVALKGKPIPSVAPLVESMFIAELKNLLLTAGHDLDAVKPPVRLDAANGMEEYTMLNGQRQVLKAGDMFIGDGLGVISSVLYGPDQRTRITSDTCNVFFAVYAPVGIEEQAVLSHLQDIRANVLLIAPEAKVEELRVHSAREPND